MSSYYPSFNYKGFNSLKDKNLIVTTFEADEGEIDTFLGMDPIYTESAYGTRRLDYGAKFNSVATVKISLIKSNKKDFTVAEVRDFLKWTTGVRQISFLDLLIGDKIQFSFLGRVTAAYQQKLDSRTIGLSIEFTSSSPWAYSPIQTFDCSFGQALNVDNNGLVSKGKDTALLDVDNGILYNGTSGGVGLFRVTNDGTVYIDNSTILQIDNQTDDLYTPIYLNMTFINDNSDYCSIKNNTIDEETIITGMSENEIITISSEQFITSDIPYKIFGDSFNFIWPRLIPGINEFIIRGSGKGTINFTYRYFIKIGDCAIDMDLLNSIDCNGEIYEPDDTTSNGNSGGNNVISGNVSWGDITNKPRTIAGYGITDVYTKQEIEILISHVKGIYVQNEEPIDANEHDIWIDMDE